MKLAMVIVIPLIVSFCLSQTTIEWQRSFGGSLEDKAYSIQKTNDGGYIVGGYTSSNDSDVVGNHGSSDFWAVKLNSLGEIVWAKCLGGTASDVGYSIKQTMDGG